MLTAHAAPSSHHPPQKVTVHQVPGERHAAALQSVERAPLLGAVGVPGTARGNGATAICSTTATGPSARPRQAPLVSRLPRAARGTECDRLTA